MPAVLTSLGEALVADLVDGTTTAPTYYIGWGTGAGTPIKGSTGLFTPASESRVATTNSQPAANTNRFVARIVAEAGKTITNFGLFGHVTTGPLVIHGSHAGHLLEGNDAIEYEITVEWS
jgi:hypothetical protein